MYHARAEHLYPAAVLAGAASLSIANWAVYVHFGTGLCEWEVTPSEANASPFTKEFASGSFEAAFEISHSTVLVNQQALDLVEHRLVRSINSFIAVDFPRYDDAYRWSHLLHSANLHR